MFIFKIKFRSIINNYKSYTSSDWIKLSIGLFVGLLFLTGLYYGFWRFFVQVQALPLIGTILLNKFLSLAFLTTFVMVIFSSIVISFSTVFFPEDISFLTALPVKSSSIFMSKTIETVIQSSWMMVATLVPFLIAFARVRNAGPEFFLVFAVIAVPFLFIASAAGVLAGLVVLYVFPSSRVRDIILVGAVLIGSSLYVLLRFLEPEKLANPEAFYDAMQYIAYLNAPVAKFLPSWWLSECLTAVVVSNTRVLLNNALMIFAAAGAALSLLYFLSDKMYFTALANIHSGRKSTKPGVRGIKRLGLIAKDVKVFFRDTKQWSQLLLVVALILVYLFSLYRVPQSLGGKGYPVKYITNFLALLNVGAAGFILAALALRFVFPQVSLERKMLWLIYGSPVSLGRFIAGKMVFSGLPMVALAVVVGVVSNAVLGVSSPEVFAITAGSIVIIAFGLLCLATGLGCLYPRFDMENVAQIETSYGGLLFTFCSLFYVGLILAAEIWPVQSFIRKQMGGRFEPQYLIFNAVDFLLINLAIMIVPLYLGINSLKKRELREWLG